MPCPTQANADLAQLPALKVRITTRMTPDFRLSLPTFWTGEVYL